MYKEFVDAKVAVDEEQVKRLEAAFCGEFEHTERAQKYKAEIKRLQARAGQPQPLGSLNRNLGSPLPSSKLGTPGRARAAGAKENAT